MSLPVIKRLISRASLDDASTGLSSFSLYGLAGHAFYLLGQTRLYCWDWDADCSRFWLCDQLLWDVKWRKLRKSVHPSSFHSYLELALEVHYSSSGLFWLGFWVKRLSQLANIEAISSYLRQVSFWWPSWPSLSEHWSRRICPMSIFLASLTSFLSLWGVL